MALGVALGASSDAFNETRNSRLLLGAKQAEVEQARMQQIGQSVSKAFQANIGLIPKAQEAVMKGIESGQMTREQGSKALMDAINFANQQNSAIMTELSAEGIDPRALGVMPPPTLDPELLLAGAMNPDQRRAQKAQDITSEEGAKQAVKVEGALAVSEGLPPEDRRRAVASSMGINIDGPQGTEFLQIMDRLRTTQNPEERALLVGRLNKMNSSGPLISIGGVVPTIDEEGNVSLAPAQGGAQGGAAPRAAAGQAGGLGKLQIGANNLDTLRGQKSVIDSGVEMIDVLLAQLESQPDRFGIAGSVQAGAENVAGMATDLARAGLSVIGLDSVAEAAMKLREAFSSQTADKEALNALAPATAGAVDVFESTLTYAIARSLQPDGRLLKSTVDAAREQAQLRGMISSGRVTERLQTVRSLLGRQSADMAARMQRGVSGSSSLGRPAIETSKPVEEMSDEEVAESLNSILGPQ